MSNQWLRLWHDMPNDPKWRTISRISGQPIALVQAVYLHLLVDASRNVTRGHVTVTAEDLSSALDVTESEVLAIQDAMQGRVLDGKKLSGWESRQPKREDSGDEQTGAKSATERKREQRQREKEAKELSKSRQCHDESRNVTLDKDTDKDKPTSLRSVGEGARDTCEGIPVPDDFQPARVDAAKAPSLGLNLDTEVERFVAHYQARSETRADLKAWEAQFRKWMLDQQQYNADRDKVTESRMQTKQSSRAADCAALGVGSQYREVPYLEAANEFR
ncbi:hypothetical protein JD974_12455 [Chromobacterium haemolyticum]|uniref:DnaT DNA-binding domain-containing protein n=1 Tax=Chromobacterium haemolyticum TaxID=394935 RepID=A0ABS3GND4_9NEIS|nr:hypothetical protein [Chromobacterium haemolyticum]MBK0415217.1 hypothetical protein [Chromobacterium haemolyticum]MBO0416568.1 hypothetical protein [Chromobacterium haemolyticum]MBO0499856.1 hypothetical protein [Chromobacterium haemolyticum]